ncbi:MAG: hypothetical protein WAM14_10835 [Candidatus Nitrosopolaris sp.]
MLNDKRTMVIALGLVAVFMMSASTFPRMAYAQQGITGKGEQNILQSEENKVKADASEGRHLILPGMASSRPVLDRNGHDIGIVSFGFIDG